MTMRQSVLSLAALGLGLAISGCEPSAAGNDPMMPRGAQLLALASQPPPPRVVEKDANDSLPIKARVDVDARLVLVRTLETMYERWPVPNGNPAEFDREIDELRRDAHRHAEYIRQRDLELDLAVRFDDLAGPLDRYQDAAARIGRIARQGAAAMDKQRADDMAKASFNGGFEAGTALAAGATGDQALVLRASVGSTEASASLPARVGVVGPTRAGGKKAIRWAAQLQQ